MCQQNEKVRWESFAVTLYSLIQDAYFDAIKTSQITVQNHLLAAQHEN